MSTDWQLQQIRTTDVDELSMSLPGWTQRYTKLERGVFRGALTLGSDGAVQVYREHTQGAILQEGETDGRMVGLAIPVRASGAVFSFGARVAAQREVMGFFAPRRLNLRTPETFELLVVSVQRQMLAEFDQCHQLWCGGRLRSARVGHLPLWIRQELVDTMLALLDPALERQRLPRARLALLDCLAEALLKFEDAPVPAKSLMCRSTVQQALATVQQWMQERADTPLNVAALCAELGLPRRTLQYCFEQALGISPLQYLKSVRLGGARRSLKQGTGSVTDASLQWGFDHPSAFARDYQAMFGELPSQTLERVRPVRLARDLARCPVF